MSKVDDELAGIEAEYDLDDGILDASKIETKQVEWLWYPYLPKSMLVMGEGESELGKTAVELDLMACMTKGRQLPDGSTVPAMGVVYVAYEDLPDYTIKPRLEAAGADLARVRIIANIKDKETGLPRPLDIRNEADLIRLRRAIVSVQAGYVVIDPITSAFGDKTDIYRTTDVRRALAPLTELARQTGATVKIMRHHKKGKADSMGQQGIGSGAFYEVARSVMGFYPDPEDETDNTRLFVHKKSNLSAKAKPLKYRLEGTRDTIVRVNWLGASTLTNRQILEGGARTGNLRNDIVNLLRNAPNGCMSTKDIVDTEVEEKGQEKGAVWTTLSRMVGKELKTNTPRGTHCLAN